MTAYQNQASTEIRNIIKELLESYGPKEVRIQDGAERVFFVEDETGKLRPIKAREFSETETRIFKR